MKIWYLQWRSRLRQERHREIPLAKNFFTVGRSPDNDLQLDDPSISRVHAILRRLDDGVMVEDADSVNGLVVDGKTKSKALIAAGASFEMGDFVFTVVRHSMHQETMRRDVVPMQDEKRGAIETVEALLGESTTEVASEVVATGTKGPHLIELNAQGGIQRTWELTGTIMSAGRSNKCGIHLQDRRVSRHHADFIFEHDCWRVEDCSSGNGIALEDGKVKDLQLLHGIRFCLGNTWFVYSEADESEAETVIRPQASWDEETTADHVLTAAEADKETGPVAPQGSKKTQKVAPREDYATRAVDLAANADNLEPSAQIETVPQQISPEEFLKDGEPCHACGKKLDEHALYCGHCGTTTPKGMARQIRRREGGFWSLLLAWLCLGGGLIFWAWGFPGAQTLSAWSGLSVTGATVLVVTLLAFVYHAAILNALAQQTETETHGWEWIPLLNLIALVHLAKLPNWYAALLLVPGLNLVCLAYIWWRIAFYRRKPRWVGLLVLVPLFGFFVPLFLAHETEDVSDGTERSLCSACMTQARRYDRFCGTCGYPRH